MAEAAMRRVKLLERRFNHRVNHPGIENSARAVKDLCLGDSFGERVCRVVDFRAAHLERLGNRKQDALEPGPPPGVVRRKVGAPKERLAIRRQERRQWPAALPGDRTDRRLIARVHVGPLVAVHFHGNIEGIDQRCDFRVLVAFAVDHVAPVAPHRADIKQDRFPLGASLVERLLTPFVPVNRLVRGRA